MASSSDLDYFAAKEKVELAAELTSKIEQWANTVSGNGLKARWIKCYRYYYGRHFGGKYTQVHSGIEEAGPVGEFKLLTVNHYRNLLKHVHILTTSQKPAFDVRAINTDPESLQQARLANSILDAYLKEKRLARHLKNAAEHSLIFGKGFVYITWEPSLGKPYTTELVTNRVTGEPVLQSDGSQTERLVYEGDIDVCTPSPFDVYVDQTKEDWEKVEWCTVRLWKNKYNLAIRYPEQKDNVLRLKTKAEMSLNLRQSFQEIDETTDVPVFAFYHKRTDAMPNGRYMLFCDDQTVLYDGPIPYKTLPIFRIVPGEVFGTTEGYSDGFDLLPLQEAVNVLESAAFTNQSAFGVQNILLPEGANISEETIGEGLRAIRYNPQVGPPSALQLTQSPPELFKNIQMKVQAMETLSGVNSVARGNPESQMGKSSSGAALALIQSMAVQYMSGFQQSWAELLEDSGTFMLQLLQSFAKTERMIAMAGKNNRGAMSSFTGDDLTKIDRVVVDIGNPMTKTTAGMLTMADNLLEKGLVKTPQEYINVMKSGNLEPILQGPQSELDLIAKENEALRDGKAASALVGDAHLLHAQEHRSVMSDPEIRMKAAAQDPTALAIVKATLDHIQQHKQLAETQEQFWSVISGEPSMAQPQQAGPPQGADPNAAPPPPGLPPQEPTTDAGVKPAQPPQPAQIPQAQ